MEEINRIERTYRRLKALGQDSIRLFSGNPNEHGFHFPVHILSEAYSKAIPKQRYRPHPKGLFAARQAIATYYDQ
jgi:aspartate/methionine/tyrosine aminotransferase